MRDPILSSLSETMRVLIFSGTRIPYEPGDTKVMICINLVHHSWHKTKGHCGQITGNFAAPTVGDDLTLSF